MARGKTFKKRFLSFMITILMMAAIVVPSFPSYAVEDKIDVGQPAYNAITGTMTYYNCLGTGVNLYKSLVINFTSVRKNGEKAILPDNMDGYVYEKKLSTDGTYVINIPDGKNLVQIAAYIRKVQFTNCQNSEQKINFSIGKDIVKYMTFYSEDSEHYYQFIKFDTTGDPVKDPSGKSWSYGTWEWAYYTAIGMKYEGLQGYLATISNAKEDAFIYKCSNEIGWLGGTRMVPGAIADNNEDGKIPHYETFNIPAEGNSGMGYWYWACGPDVKEATNGKFLQTWKVTNANYSSTMQSADSAGYYNNWNNGEPNNSGNEFVMTTLKIGSGWNTGGRNGKITSGSDYYVASGYSWNDIVDTNWAPYGSSRVNDYTATGFFVEYGDYVKGLSKTAIKQQTNFEFKTTTKPLSHVWNLYAAEGSDTVKMYCTATDPKCSYFAANSSSLGKTIDCSIRAEDVPYTGKVYNSAEVIGANDLIQAADKNATVTDIAYYKTTSAGATSGGTAVAGAPKDIGYYYAEITVSVRNTGTTAATSTTATAKAVTPFKIYDPDAQFDVENLNNNKNSSVPYQTKVNGDTAHSDLEIVFATGSDTFKMYKIADMDWNGSTLNKIAWVNSVQSWINTSEYATTAKTPYDLANGKASSSTISSFYRDMLRTDENPMALTGISDIADLDGIGASANYNYPSEYKRSYYKYVDEDGNQVAAGANGAKKYSVTYDDIEFGIYAILAKDSGGNDYAVTVAAVYPQQSGPNDDFYIQDLFTVYIKEVEPTIDKFINDKKQDIGEIDDTDNPIKFTVDFQLPQYKDRLTTGTGSGYQLSFEDQMAPGFTMYDDAATGGDHTLQFFYTYKDGAELKEAPIAAEGIPTAISYKFTEDSLGDTSIPLSNKNAKEGTVEYTSSPTSTTILTKNTDLIGSFATPRTSAIFEPFEVYSADNGSTVIKITFDEPAVRSWKTSLPDGRDLAGFRIKYYAVLDNDAVINSNANSNTAYVRYEKDSSGKTMTEMHDTVYAYTYGLNIIKIDGSAAETAYLAGAEFKLYKELLGDNIPTTEADIEAITADQENYYVLPGDTDRYFKKVVMNNGTFVSKNNDKVYDTLVSVGNANGITAKGLGDGNYILVETKAPTGYNELAEDIYFEINRLADDELSLSDNSYIWFREMATDEKPYIEHNIESVILNEKGCISIDVYNYQGLTLPSTGGMGILLFIIIGTAVMATVLIILLGKRRKMAEA